MIVQGLLVENAPFLLVDATEWMFHKIQERAGRPMLADHFGRLREMARASEKPEANGVVAEFHDGQCIVGLFGSVVSPSHINRLYPLILAARLSYYTAFGLGPASRSAEASEGTIYKLDSEEKRWT
jgi:hypothetical protein